MPKGDEYRDSKFIPRPYVQEAVDWFKRDMEAKARLARLMGRIEPLRGFTKEDEAFLLANRISPF